MSDYDLGRAHGRIEIDADVDVDKVSRGLDRVRDSVDRFSKKIQETEKAFSRFEFKMDQIKAKAQAMAGGIASAIRSLSDLGTEAAKTALEISGVSEAFQDLKSGAVSAAKGVLAVQAAISSLSGAGAVAKTLAFRMLGVNQEMQRFPQWTRDIVKASAALGTVTGAVSTLRKVAPRLIPGFAGLAAAAVAMNDKLRITVMTLGTAYPAFGRAAEGAKKFAIEGKRIGKGLEGSLHSMARMITYTAVFASGIRGLSNTIKKIVPFLKYFAIGVAGFGILAPLGTGIMGLVDALKQLSGVAALIPGAFATMFVSMSVARVAVAGLAEAFKAGWEDADKFEEATKDLSPRLKGLAKDVQGFKKPLTDLRNEITETAFSDLIDDFKPLVERYLPLLRSGSLQVSEGLNDISGALIRTVSSSEAMRGIAQIFTSTATALGNVSMAVPAAVSGISQITAKSTLMLSELTGGLGGLSALFNLWATRVSTDGSLEDWAQRGIQGVRDLGSILTDTWDGIKQFFHAFGADGSNALERLAAGAQKFSDSMRGLDGSDLGKIIDHIKSASISTLSGMIDIVKEVVSSLVAIIPQIENFSQAFGTVFINAVKIATNIIEGFAKVMGLLHLDSKLGMVLGLVAAFRLIAPVVMVVVNALKLLSAALIVKNAQSAILGLAGMLDGLASKTGKVGAAAAKTQGLLLSMASAISGPMIAGLMILATVLLSVKTNSDAMDKAQKNNIQTAKETKEAYRGVAQAYQEAEGQMDGKVFDSVGKSLDAMTNKLDRWSSQDTGAMRKSGAMFMDTMTEWETWIGRKGSRTQAVLDDKALKERADRVKASLADLGWSQEDLAKAVAGSSGEFNRLTSALAGTGEGAAEAIEELTWVRNDIVAIKDSLDRIGPNTMKLNNALSTLADSSATAADKISAMKSALEAMGLLQVSEAEAFANLREEIDNFAQSMAQGVPGLASLGSALNENTGVVDQSNEAYGALAMRMAPLRDKLMAVAASGGDLKTAWSEMQPELSRLRDSLGLSEEKFQLLLSATGLLPETIQMMVNLEGVGDGVRSIAILSSTIGRLAGKEWEVPVTTTIKDQNVIAQLQAIRADVQTINSTTGEVKISFPTEQVYQDYLKLVARIEYDTGIKIGIQLDPEDRKAVDDHIAWLKSQGRVRRPDAPGIVDGQATPPPPARGPPPAGTTPPPGGTTPPPGGNRGPKPTPPGAYNPNSSSSVQKWQQYQEDLRRWNAGAPAENTPPPGNNTPAPGNNTPPPAENTPAPGNNTPPPGDQNNRQINVVIGGGDHLAIIQRIADAVNGLPAEKIVKVIIGGGDHMGILGRIKAVVDGLPPQKIINVVIGGGDHIAILARIASLVNSLPSRKVIEIIIGGGDHLGIIQAIVDKLAALGPAAAQAQTAVVNACNAMGAAANNLKNAVAGVGAAMQTVSSSAFARGQNLGQGYANGILSKVEAVRAAGIKLAEAASGSLGNSPAKWGPLSGKGWTLYRGKRLAGDYAQGIIDETGTAKIASLGLAVAVSKVMDSFAKSFGKPFEFQQTFFDANRTPGPGGKRYYRDPEISDEELRQARVKKAQEEAQNQKDDAYREAKKAGRDIPEQERKVRDAIDRTRKAQDRFNKAKTPEERSRAEDRLADARVKQKDAEDKLKQMRDYARNNPDAANAGAALGGVKGGLRPSPARTDYVNAMSDIAKRFNLQLISGYRDEPGSHHSTGEAGDFSNSTNNTPEMLAFANFIADNFRPWTRELIYDDPAFNRQIKEGKFVGGRNEGFYAQAGDHTNHVHWAVKEAPEWTGAIGRSVTDAINNGAQDGAKKAAPKVGDVLTVPLVDRGNGKYGSSSKEWDKLINRESGGDPKIIQGIQDANSGGNEASGLFQIAKGTWAANGGLKYGTEARFATPEQQAEIAAKIFEKSGGAPWGAVPGGGREDEAGLRAGLVRGGQPSADGDYGTTTEKTAEEQLTALRQGNKKLDQNLKILENPKSSEPEVIRALQDLDDTIAGTEDPDIRDQLEAIRNNTMQDRGIKEYDPKENAPETPKEWFDTIFKGLAQNGMNLFKTVESGLESAAAMGELLVRGFSNTKDVNTFIDGVQSLVGAVTEVVSTVANIATTIANIAAAAGQAIPGVGQVAAIISSVTGGIADISSVVDMAQEVFSIGSRFFGKIASNILGLGGTGELQGQIRTLLDMNDMTIKTWSDRNAADKSVMGLPGTTPTNPNAAPVVGGDLNVYQGPGEDPAKMMNNAMFAIAAHSTGVYSG